ncbi:hypothetical protein ASE56_10435 [Microbacterium sp. Leaf203]|nr:hypothetical protein ASE56_10435 [Microbacterium sp. Leaf203]
MLKKGTSMFHYTVAVGLNDSVPTIADCRPGEHLANEAARAIDADIVEFSYLPDASHEQVVCVVASNSYGSPYLNPLLTAIVSRLRGEFHPVYGSGTLLASSDDYMILPLTPAQAQRMVHLCDDVEVRELAEALQATRSSYDLV